MGITPTPHSDSQEAEGEKALRIGSGGVVCLANDLLPVDAKNWYIPVGLL